MAEVVKRGRWQPGESGNPGGRPLGSRNRFSENFISDLSETWARHGKTALEKMATEEHARFVEVCGRLIPRDVSLTITDRMPGGLEPQDWQLTREMLEAVKIAIPDASERPPGTVLAYVLDAIRAQEATPLIETAATHCDMDKEN